MKNLFLIISLLSLSAASYALKSPFPSSVPELTIPNSHEVSQNIYRGMAPLGHIQELIDFGVTDILIFKNQTRNEIDRELAELAELNAKIKVKRIDFLWHDLESNKKACEQVIAGLKLFKAIDLDPKRKIFFHCTVGEDRTGLLGGIWDMLKNKKSQRKVFKEQMCENGYEAGNPQKPFYVVNEIRKDLTPLFLFMANLVKEKKLTLSNLDKSLCQQEIPKPKRTPKCKKSSNYKR